MSAVVSDTGAAIHSAAESESAPTLLQHFDLLATAPGGVTKLRELILTLAVQGKLVAQDPADEPASELLKKIRIEKDRLITDGKIKRDKPLAEITEEKKPFELPQGWEWVRWANIAMKIGDIDHKMPSEAKEGIPYVSPRDFYGSNEIDFDGAKKIAYSDYVELAAKIRPEVGDLIYPRYGTIGVVRKVTTDREFLASYSCAVIKVLRGCVEPDYQYLFSVSECVKAQAASATNKTTQPNVGLKSIQEYLMPLPPLPEQSRIVTRVEELMRLCDALETKGKLDATQHAQLLNTLLGQLHASATPEELAADWQRVAQHFDLLLDRPEAVDALEQTLLQLAVRGLLVPQDPSDEPASALLQRIRAEKDRLIAEGKIKRDKPLPPITEEEKPFLLPVGWDWVSVATIFDTTSGSTFNPEMEKESGAYMYVKVGDMNLPGNEFEITTSSRFIDPDKKNLKALIPSGSIIFPKRGGAIATNKKRVVPKPIFVDLNTMAITPILIPTEYAILWLMTVDLASLNTGTSVPQINHKDIDPLPFPLPPLPEQSRIVTRVAELRRLCVDLRQRLAKRQSVQANLAEALVASVA